jgi:hypothetical protein
VEERFETAPGHQAQGDWSHEQPIHTPEGLELPLYAFHIMSRTGIGGGLVPWFRPRGRRVFRDAKSEEVSSGVDRAGRSADA